MRQFDKIFVNGQWRSPLSSRRIEVVCPHTEQVIAAVPDGNAEDMERAVAAARLAFDHGDWPMLALSQRIKAVARLATAYERRIPQIADVITAELGTPVASCQLMQATAAWAELQAFINIAQEFEWDATRPGAAHPSVRVRREPVGVVAAIVPWNVPQLAAISKIAPALLAGCTVVLKPAPETPLDCYELFEAVEEADFPPGVVNMVPAGREAGEALVRNAGVDKVAFTGSTTAGRRIAGICGEQLKRCSLELGGKSAAVILDDADLALTMQGLKTASFLNSGQACTNQTRVLVSRQRYSNTVEAIVECVRAMQVGDPRDPVTEIGPMVTRRHQERVQSYIKLGEAEGAKIAIGGHEAPAELETGWYVKPTVFIDAGNDMRICQEEIFGPVIAVIPYDGVEDAVRQANQSQYGLAGSVWTADREAGEAIAKKLGAGMIGINDFTPDFMAPFGGYKASGIGRELGPEGLAAYTELKTIYPAP